MTPTVSTPSQAVAVARSLTGDAEAATTARGMR